MNKLNAPKQFWLVLMAATLACTGFANSSFAESVSLQKQDLTEVRKKAEEFLVTQSVGYPGTVKVTAGQIDKNLKLVSCPTMEAFLPAGSRAWGKTSVGIRCNGQTPWTIYLQATVSVTAQYLVAASPLAQGQLVGSQDIVFENGDLTQLPAGIFTDPEQVLGRLVSMSMPAGSVLRQEMLKFPPVVQQGQKVLLTSIGRGFSVSAEGEALGKANIGQIVQVRVANGQVVSGIARPGGQIEVGF